MSVRRLAPLSAWMAITAALCWAPAALAECPGTEGGRHRRGDLKSITTPDGKVTWFTDYNGNGQLLRSVAPDCVVTLNTYDLRGRLLTHTEGPHTTRFTYDPVGQVTRITLPDDTWLGFDYDDAHRLVAHYDNTGSRIEYRLDQASRLIGERVNDPDGSVRAMVTRAMDALGRAQRSVRPGPTQP